MFQLHCFLFILSVVKVFAVPPAACRAEFRWDDCGKPPTPVMYYWKLGSRCEIGYWKGCLPNPNMFADEYECINTCVFVDRPPARSDTGETEPETITDHENTKPENEVSVVDENGTTNSNESSITVETEHESVSHSTEAISTEFTPNEGITNVTTENSTTTGQGADQ